MSGNDQDVLSVYLQKVMELSDGRSTDPTEAELRTIAREVGISDEVLAAAAKSAEDHQTRGLGFLDHGRYDDAVAELAEAAALAPGRLDLQHALARAYAGRYGQRGDAEDRQRAETLARRCLELDPDHQASFEILNALDRPPEPVAGSGSGNAFKLGAAVLGVLVLGGGLLLYQSSPAPAPSSGPTETGAQSESSGETVPPPSSTSSPNAAPSINGAPSTGSSSTAADAELDIPIELDTEADPDLDLGFDLRLSRLNNYTNGRSFYNLNAVLANQGRTELEKVAARLDFLDADDQVVKKKDLDLVSGSAPPLRPGDLQAVQQLVEVTSQLRRAELVVVRVEQTPAAEDYGASGPVELQWQGSPPAGMELAARERSRRYSKNVLSKSGGGYFEAVLEIDNVGGRSIRALQLKATIVGPDNAWTTEIERHVVARRGPDLRADESRIVRFLGQVQERPAEYRVSVVGIE